MSTTFKFEELDHGTHDYLVAVRGAEGRGAPGVFVNTRDALPGFGCIAGPIVVIATLLVTLTSWLNVVYEDPVKVALLQTGGLLVGAWLLAAGFRGKKGTGRIAGTWVYVDPLFLYEAYREQITVTPIEEVEEANFTHNYNNGSYQNSTVRISMGHRRVTTVTLANEARAEQMVVYLNYLAWARGPEGGERAKLAPATLGGLARYVARNDHEPLDADNNINLNLIELEFPDVPEEPAREGRAAPSLLPYVFMLVFAVVCFAVMAYIVNPPVRDDALFDLVMKEPWVEPRFLRVYLVDPRNTAHRDEVTTRLKKFYSQPIEYVKNTGKDDNLKKGMMEILNSLSTADQPVVSIRVTELNTPASKESSKATRTSQLQTDFAVAVGDEFSKQPWGQPIKPGDGVEFKPPLPPPLGQQMIAFVEAPDGAEQVHFDIKYTIEPAGDFGALRLSVLMEIRTNIEDKTPTARSQFTVPGTFDAKDLDSRVAKLKDELIGRVVGVAPPQFFGMPPAPQMPKIVFP